MQAALLYVFADLSRRVAPVALAQDAACPSAGEKPLPGAPHGAFCLAIATPPAAELAAVLAEVDNVGRASLIPDPLGSSMRRFGNAARPEDSGADAHPAALG